MSPGKAADRRIGLLIVGDEILSGKRQDKHLTKVIELLRERGLGLAWVRMAGDDAQDIAEAVAWGHARGDVILSCGGIGATPDDCTRQGAALAFGVAIERHPEASALIISQYGPQGSERRLIMAEFPKGAGLIPNPVNRVAGFFYADCNFVPGFPEMAWPMLEWVLDQRYAHLHRSEPDVEFSLRVVGTTSEGDLLPLMEDTLSRYAGIRLSSLPTRGDANTPRQIEFGFKGEATLAAAAYRYFRSHMIELQGVTTEDLCPPQ